MSLAYWVLIVVTHVNAGAAVSMHDFGDKQSCEFAGQAAVKMSNDITGFGYTRTWCVRKQEQQ